MKLAILFPGQGSQFPGMGKDFYDHYPTFKQRFDWIEEQVNLDLKSCCFGNDPRMEDTRYAQLATVVTSSLIGDLIKERIDLSSSLFLGHSLGEYSALYAAGVFSFESCLQLVRKRGDVMSEAAKEYPGGMAAILGGDESLIERLCGFLQQKGYLIEIANYNLPTQTVISGTLAGLDEFQNRLEETKAKRMIRLKVSGPFHSSLMRGASQKLGTYLKTIKRQTPQFPILMNCDATPLILEKLDDCLSSQLCHPVRFYQSILSLANKGFKTFIEVGPGSVLTNCVRKLIPSADTGSINTVSDLTRLEELCRN